MIEKCPRCKNIEIEHKPHPEKPIELFYCQQCGYDWYVHHTELKTRESDGHA